MWLYIPSTCAVDTTGSGSPLTSQQADNLARFVMWRSKYQQPRFWQTLWAKGFYPKRLSGPTCEPSTLNLGAGLWILSLQGIRVNRSQSPESVVARAIQDTCGPKWLESWRNASQLLVSSRMSEGTLGLDSIKSPKTWNDWATALRQECLRRRKLARVTRENGCSSWRTARANDWKGGVTGEQGSSRAESDFFLPDQVNQWASPASADSVGSHGVGQGRSLRTDIAENWATPQAFDAKDVTRQTPCKTAGCRTLANDLAKWPAPKTNEANSPGVHGNGGQDLRTVVAENCSLQAQATSDGDESSNDGPTSRPQLNPRFVEWLMGVPHGWTSLECSATELSRYKALTRSALCRLCSDSVGQVE